MKRKDISIIFIWTTAICLFVKALVIFVKEMFQFIMNNPNAEQFNIWRFGLTIVVEGIILLLIAKPLSAFLFKNDNNEVTEEYKILDITIIVSFLYICFSRISNVIYCIVYIVKNYSERSNAEILKIINNYLVYISAEIIILLLCYYAFRKRDKIINYLTKS